MGSQSTESPGWPPSLASPSLPASHWPPSGASDLLPSRPLSCSPPPPPSLTSTLPPSSSAPASPPSASLVQELELGPFLDLSSSATQGTLPSSSSCSPTPSWASP